MQVRAKRTEGLSYDVLKPELQHSCGEAEVVRAINIGLLCTQFYPERRPSMSQVVAMFLGRMDVEVLDEFDQSLCNLTASLATANDSLDDFSLVTVQEESAVFPLLDSQSSSMQGSMATKEVQLSSGR